ncbi:MAG: hypothetical protein KIT84_37865 [Labilithrix sp.]|nr:hypothetical protein [Labilithrix sp.]MCW5816825.1 hypothetical protein [Labilithrix sp.]
MMRAVVLGSVVFFAGCTTSTPPPAPANDLRVPPLPPSSASAAAQTQTQVQPEPRPRHPAGELMIDDPNPMPALGGPCSTAAACGKSGKLAVARRSFHGGPPPQTPCKLVALSERAHAMDNAPMACVDAGRVFVATVCMYCRITREERFVGAIDDMTPAQLAEAQKLATLPAEPLLTTADAWSRAIAAHGHSP